MIVGRYSYKNHVSIELVGTYSTVVRDLRAINKLLCVHLLQFFDVNVTDCSPR